MEAQLVRLVKARELIMQKVLDLQERERPRVGLLGASFDTGNLGVGALAAASIKCVLRRWPEAEIFIVGSYVIDAPVIHNSLPIIKLGEDFHKAYCYMQKKMGSTTSSHDIGRRYYAVGCAFEEETFEAVVSPRQENRLPAIENPSIESGSIGL